MPWRAIDPQPVRVVFDGKALELNADRWDDFSGAVGCPAPPTFRPRLTVLAGEYTPVDEASFENACAVGTRI